MTLTFVLDPEGRVLHLNDLHGQLFSELASFAADGTGWRPGPWPGEESSASASRKTALLARIEALTDGTHIPARVSGGSGVVD